MHREEIEVSVRESLGRGSSRRLRLQGKVPAILYGSGVEPLRLEIHGHSLDRVIRTGTTTLIDLVGAEAVQGRQVLVKEIQRHPVTRQVIHCDLYAIDPNKKLQVSVPIHYAGKPAGIEEGGIFEVLVREVEVRCLPLEIPDRISIDVSKLQIGDGVHFRDLDLPDTVEGLADAALALAHVSVPRVEVVEEPTEEEVAAVPGEEAPATEGVEPEKKDD